MIFRSTFNKQLLFLCFDAALQRLTAGIFTVKLSSKFLRKRGTVVKKYSTFLRGRYKLNQISETKSLIFAAWEFSFTLNLKSHKKYLLESVCDTMVKSNRLKIKAWNSILRLLFTVPCVESDDAWFYSQLGPRAQVECGGGKEGWSEVKERIVQRRRLAVLVQLVVVWLLADGATWLRLAWKRFFI